LRKRRAAVVLLGLLLLPLVLLELRAGIIGSGGGVSGIAILMKISGGDIGSGGGGVITILRKRSGVALLLILLLLLLLVLLELRAGSIGRSGGGVSGLTILLELRGGGIGSGGRSRSRIVIPDSKGCNSSNSNEESHNLL